MMLPLAALLIVWHIVIWLWVAVAVAIILVVLIQKGRGGGLAAAFGGAGASSLLGTKTGDFLTWMTIGLVAVFLILSVVMGLFMRPIESKELTMPAAPAGPVMPITEAVGPVSSTETMPVEAAGSGQTTAQPATPAEGSAAGEQPEGQAAQQPAGEDPGM